jgi:hypothetical protein
MSDSHTNIRDEQFWFTAAVVGFNTVIIGADGVKLPVWFLVLASAMVSLFGAHLILTRWLAASGRSRIDSSYDNTNATVWQRGRYTLGEIRGYIRGFPYIVMELSGSLFYLLLIALTFAGVIYRVLTYG